MSGNPDTQPAKKMLSEDDITEVTLKQLKENKEGVTNYPILDFDERAMGLLTSGVRETLASSRVKPAGGPVYRFVKRAFDIFASALALLVLQMVDLLGRMMQCSGNMKIPSILDILMCVLDVAFNFIFIMLLKLGVLGAALGTLCAMLTVLLLGIYFACFHSPVLRLGGSGKVRLQRECLRMAAKISLPMGFEQIALCGAMVLTTGIVAPLGTVAIAANSFAITAESLCYMPGYGIASAATTLVGQSVGAGRTDLAKGFAWVTAGMGMVIMSLCGIVMYFACPAVFAFLTPDGDVRTLGTTVLRLELIAEPLFAASIVANGALRGAGDTLIPGIMTLSSIWGVRLTLSLLLVRSFGLQGVWIAMAAELCVRGVMFLFRLDRKSTRLNSSH